MAKKEPERAPAAPPKAPELGQEVVDEVVRRGESARESATLFDPPSRAGFDAWAEKVRASRELLVPKGWTPSDEKNLSLIASPSGRDVVAIVTGDPNVGNTDRSPQPKHPRGEATAYAAVPNAQGELFGTATHQVFGAERPWLWFLLVYRDDSASEVRVELSLPEAITDDGFVTKWLVRHHYRPVPLDGAAIAVAPAPPPSPLVDVPVRRRR